MRNLPARLLAPALVLALALALPARADEAPPGTVSTTATARKRLPNTVADVGIGIEAHARTVVATHKVLAEGSATLLAYLRGTGAERLQTDQLALTPNTETDRGRGLPDRIIGYDGRMRLSFRVPADKLPEVLGNVLDKGGNSLAGITMTPREAEVDAARQELAAEATRTAMAEAQAMATAAGRRLGAVRQITLNPGGGSIPSAMSVSSVMRSMRPAAAAPIATEGGDTEMAASVAVTVNLIEP